MQRKLKDIYSPSDAIRAQSQIAGRMESSGMGGNMSKPSQDAYQRATMQSRREVDQMLASEVKRQDQLSKTIEQRISKLQKLKEQQAELTKGSEDELKVKEKISRMESNNSRLREIERGRAQAINQTLDARDSMKPSGFGAIKEGYQNGGIRGAAAAGGDFLKGMSPTSVAGVIGSVLTVTGIAAKIGGDLYNSYKNAPISTASNYGSAMTGVMGDQINGAFSGRSAMQMAFSPERNKAMGMAREGMKGERVSNAAGAAGSILGYAGAGAGLGAGAGAIGGLGVGSWLTAPIGAAIGGVAGAGYGAYKSMTGESGGKQSALMKGAFSDTHNQEYEGMMAKEFAGKYQEAMQGLKEQNPLKTRAFDNYDNSYMRNLDVQRSMGMDNIDFHGKGGFRENAINNGFTDDMAMGASSGILSANGSTDMAKNSVSALQASRQFNQTNAQGVMGQLSGNLGSSESTKQAYVKMLAEGTRIGLDTSTYAEESRKMMEVQAAVITKSGASSSADIDRIVSQMGGFLNEKTNKGVQSAKDAFDFYNQASSETGGARGIMRASGMMKDPVLGKMDAATQAQLGGLQADQMSTDDPLMKSIAKQYETTPEEIIKRMNAVNKQSFNYRKSTDDAMNKGGDLKKQLSGMSPNDPRRQEIESQLEDQRGLLTRGIAQDNPGMPTRQRNSITEGLLSGDPDQIKKSMSELATSQQMDKQGGTGRMEDTSVAGAAEGSRLVLDNFIQFKNQLAPTAEAVKQFNDELVRTINIISKMPAGPEKTKLMGTFHQPETQNQGGKSSK